MDTESRITFEIPSSIDLDSLIKTNNYSLLFSQLHSADTYGSNRLVKDLFSNRSKTMSDIEYERFMNEVWITLVLVLFILSIVFCLCSCLLYHKFRQWKRSVSLARASASAVNNVTIYESDHDSLPSYTLVSGLPSYDDALEQMKSKLNHKSSVNSQKRPSLTKLFNFNDNLEKSDITNYQAPEDTATSAPSYEVSVILPQKSAHHEKCIPAKPTYTMEPITDLPPSHILSNGESFIINFPSSTNTTTTTTTEEKSLLTEVVSQKPIYSHYNNDILTPEISKDRKLQIISSNMKIKANSLSNLCEIHR
ncbi:protein commissureless 2 homolog [Culicoides brevitarsis]|uniref:protein commissureless 2 homolog n=1 Tax=Culicoides brevitarsis TaxID=469753 RepID=UPI00307BADC2